MSKDYKVIAFNRRAQHDYFIEQKYEAGLVLQGWEVKSLRAGKCQLAESYIILKDSAPWLIGAHISALKTVSTHIQPDPTRSRKLLLNAKELKKLFGGVQQKGYTLVPLRVYFKNAFIKIEIALAKGKKDYDKRATLKEKQWKREQERYLRRS